MVNMYTVQVSDDLSAPLYAIPQRSIRLECVDPAAPVFTEAGIFGNETFQLQDICAVTIQTEGTVVTGPPIITPGTKSPTTPTPTVQPSTEPTLEPTEDPTEEPTIEPTEIISTTDSDEDDDDQGKDEATAGLGTGGIIGIVAGIVVLIVIILILVYCLVLKPKKDGNEYHTASKDGIEINKMKSASNDGDEAGALNTGDD